MTSIPLAGGPYSDALTSAFNWQTMRILIIDEEVNIRRVLVCTVEQEHNATAVDSWSKASALLEKQCFDTVLLDLHLTGADGFEVLSELTSNPNCSGVIAYSTSANREEVLRRGASVFLTQPFTPSELRAGLSQVRQHSRRVQMLES